MSVQSTLNSRRNSVMRTLAFEATRRGSWVVTIGTVLLVLAALTLVTPVVQGGGWYLPVAIAVIATLVAVQAVRAFTGNLLATALVGLAGLVLSVALLSSPEHPLALLTSPLDRFVEFGEQMASDRPPLRESVAVNVVLGAVAVAVAVVMDVLAQTLRAVAVAPVALVPLVIVPVTVGVVPAEWYFWALTLLALVLHFTLGHRWLQQGDDAARTAFGFTAHDRGSGGIIGAFTTGVATIAIAALIAVLLPPTSGAWWGAFNGKSGLSTNRVNPIIDLGDDLRRENPIDIFRYATSQTSGELPYISLTTLSEISAEQEWVPANSGTLEAVHNGEQPGNPDLRSGANVLEVNSNIVLEAGVTSYLPHIGTPNEITDLTGSYVRDPANGDLQQADAEALGQSYQANSTVPRPSFEQLRTALPATPSELDQYTELPEDAALDEIRRRMNDVIDPNLSPYAQALQLQEWFTGGAFDYSEQSPVENNYDGTSLEVITQFLQVRSGYCVHFASTMAVMGRLLGLPTRVQVGFTPGTQESANELGQPVYVVTTDDLHAWAEFWVPGYGWVPFETTPSEGVNQLILGPEQTEQQAAPSESPATPSQTPTPTPSETTAAPTPEQASGPDETTPPQQRDSDGMELARVLHWLGIALAIALPLLLLTLLALLPMLVRRVRTRSRLRQVRSNTAALISASEAAWSEVTDTARDFGTHISAANTTGAQLTELREAVRGHPRAQDAAGRLAAARNAAHFADPAHPDPVRPNEADVRTVREALREAASSQRRREARWLPISVVPARMRPALRQRRARRARRQKRADE